ncbi:MAG: GerMN domain-containing protein [Anaerocolumna sp.]
MHQGQIMVRNVETKIKQHVKAKMIKNVGIKMERNVETKLLWNLKEVLGKERYSHRKSLSLVLLILTALLLLCGCQSEAEDNAKGAQGSDTVVYYIDVNETKLIAEPFELTSTTREEQVDEYMKALSSVPEDLALVQVLPDDIEYELGFNDGNRLTIYFNSNYSNLSGVREVLCRASIVKTLCQIEEIEDIEFYVSGQPLKMSNEKVVGAMEATEFIDDSSAENVVVNVYFPNEEGDKMVSSILIITSYDGNISIEKLILNQLIKGPIEEKMQKAIPDGTALLNVRTKDGTCSVDFNEKFLEKVEGVEPEVVIYSVVNSLVQLTSISKVQFTINGQSKKIYREDIPFSNAFERNLELIEEGSK